MEVDGSVKSGGGVAFSGNFAVRDRIEAYGDISIVGDLRCRYVCVLLLFSGFCFLDVRLESGGC